MADYGPFLSALAKKDAEITALKAENARLRGERFAPCGDNHHNAALCPHCGEPLRKADARVKELEAGMKALDETYYKAAREREKAEARVKELEGE